MRMVTSAATDGRGLKMHAPEAQQPVRKQVFILSALSELLQMLCARDLGGRPCPGASHAEAPVAPVFLSTGSWTPFLSVSPRTSFLPMFPFPPAQSINGFYWTTLRGRPQALTTLILNSKAETILLASSHVSSFQPKSFFQSIERKKKKRHILPLFLAIVAQSLSCVQLFCDPHGL